MREPFVGEIRYYKGGTVAFLRHETPAKPAATSAGSQDDRHIEHPRLGQIDTGGNRFGAIIEASKRLHGLQSGSRFAFEMRQRFQRTSAVPFLRDRDEDE